MLSPTGGCQLFLNKEPVLFNLAELIENLYNINLYIYTYMHTYICIDISNQLSSFRGNCVFKNV
jgi:hypothetical protein